MNSNTLGYAVAVVSAFIVMACSESLWVVFGILGLFVAGAMCTTADDKYRKEKEDASH